MVNVQLKKIRKRREMRKQQETNAAEHREATGFFISPSVPVIVARARRARETERRGRNCTRMFGRLLLSALSSARSSSARSPPPSSSRPASALDRSVAAPFLRALRGEAAARARADALPASAKIAAGRGAACAATRPPALTIAKAHLKRPWQRQVCEFA